MTRRRNGYGDKKLEQSFSVCQVEDYSLVNLDAEYCFIGKTDEETSLVCAAGNSGINCLYFYPKEYIEKAERRGLADKDAVMKKGKRFMLPFCVVMFAVLIVIISVWNGGHGLQNGVYPVLRLPHCYELV